jgi:hypothetical protein
MMCAQAEAKSLACSDVASTPGSSRELPLPRLIIAPPEIVEVAACTSAKDANCALLNSIMSCAGLKPLIVRTGREVGEHELVGRRRRRQGLVGRRAVDEPHIIVEDVPTRARDYPQHRR